MQRQYKREPLSNEETSHLINACETLREKQIILILLDTGLRVSELENLSKNNILWQEHRLVIYGKGGIYGKQSKVRVLPMTERVRTLVEHHYTMSQEFGISKRQIERIVKRVANRAAITKPVTPHVLRHTFSVNCLKRGITTRTLQYLLGHDHITTTEIYMNLSPEDAIREFQSKW
jgi:integrase/recombinase XerD